MPMLKSFDVISKTVGLGHIEWYQTVEVDSVYHCTKFDQNRLTNVRIHTSVN